MQVESSYQSITLQKSPNDKRIYEALVLKNGLKIVLIEDQTLQKSACSISVGVGSFQDPLRSLGLAHFLQHMLFMGSQKYPSQNEYASFINLNSGMDNAYTSDTQTNYYFEIKNQAFIQGVQRITNFFTGALLTQSCITKERQAVHEEYVLWTNDDNCRKWEVLRKLAQGKYNKFSIGNNQTLNHAQIRNDLVNFYEENYSANRINAVLCSNKSINQMKEKLIPFFEQIKNKQLQTLKYQPFFKSQNTGKLIKMQSIKDETIMEFFWVVEHLKFQYKKHIQQYISHILGHEGKNSLFSILKLKGYASQISSYHHDIGSQTIIGLQIHLTQSGVQNDQEVYNIVIDYTNSLKASKHIYQQIKHKGQISFKFKEKIETSRYVCNLSSCMQYIDLPQILNYKYIYEEFDFNYVQKVLKQLNPFNLIVVYSNSEELQNSITQKYLGANYRIDSLPQRKTIIPDFQSLLINPFIPLNTDVVHSAQQKVTPKRISQNVVFLHDSIFKVCKGGVRIILEGMINPVLRQFYCQYLDHLLKEITYDAQTLDVKLSFDSENNIQIQIYGFNDTVSKLIKKLGQHFVNCHKSQQSQSLFKLSQNKLLEDYQNFFCEDVDQIAETNLSNLLRNQNVDIQEILTQLEGFQYADQSEKILNFLKNCQIKWIFIGNFIQSEILQLVKEFQGNIGCKKTLKPLQIKCRKLTQSYKHLTELDSQEISTSGCIVYYQAGNYTEKLYYILRLLKNYIQEPFFDQLRTQKQMAYYLATRLLNERGVLGLYFILVSSTKDPENISIEIIKFVTQFIEKMKTNVNEEKLNQLKDSVKTNISAPHNNLKSLFQFTCRQIQNSTFYFNRKNKEELDNQLKGITMQDLIETSQRLLKNRLQIHVLAKNHLSEFQSHNNKTSYSQFTKIKKGEYYQDFILKHSTQKITQN